MATTSGRISTSSAFGETFEPIRIYSSSQSFSGNYDAGDMAWTLSCTALVWLMVPGVGFFYSGMARSKSALSLIILCVWSIAVVSVQWFMFGYSLAFSFKGNPFIGNVDNAFLMGILNINSTSLANPRIPEILFCSYQGMIAGITPALVVGATAERGRFLPTVVFMFVWTTLVYDVLVYWTWGPHGWIKTMGGIDFAGGMPVHIASGAAAAAYASILGVREGSMKDYKPHNIVQVVLGTSLIWFGWFGFNGGSAHGANPRSAVVVVVTNLSASVGGITWALYDYRKEGTFSALSFCFGAVAGLVCITPGSGYIHPASAVFFGFFGALGCNAAIRLKDAIGFDDALDVVAVHGVGGIIGTLLTGIFAQKDIASLDGMSYCPGGWLDGHWAQFGYQLVCVTVGLVWSFGLTYGILFVMNKIPGLQLRVDDHVARAGLDKNEVGENAYERISEGSGSQV